MTIFARGEAVNSIESPQIARKKRLQEGVTADTLVGEALLQNPSDNVSAIIMNVFKK